MAIFPRTALLLLILATALLYSPVANFDFINWDDDLYIIRDDNINKGISLEGVAYAFSAAKPFPMPLTRLLFMSQVELFGLFPGGFHLVNVLFHLANIWLVGWLLWRLTGEPWGAVVVAAVFALHPQRVEAVAWVTELKEVMATFFGLFALLSYEKYCRQSRQLWFFFGWLAMLASLLVKPTWVVLPLLLLILDGWPLGRWQKGWWFLCREKWPFFSLTALFSLLTLAGFSRDSFLISFAELSLWERVGHGLQALARYLEAAVLPWGLIAYHPMPPSSWDGVALSGGVALLLITGLGWYWRRQRPYVLAGWLWFLVILLPVSGLVTGGITILTADRWTYGAHVGLAIALVWLGKEAWPRWLGVGVVAAFLMVLSVTTASTLGHWRNSGTLWSRVATVLGDDPGSGYAHGMWGRHLSQNGDHGGAVVHFLEAARRNPNFPFFALEVGNAYLHLGNTGEAWHWYHRLATLENTPPTVLLEVGRFGLLNRQYQEATVYWDFLEPLFRRQFPEELATVTLMTTLAKQGAGLASPEIGPSLIQAYLAGGDPSLRCQQVLEILVNLPRQTTTDLVRAACQRINAS